MDAVTVVNSIASGSLATGTSVASGPAGTILYVGIGVGFVLAVAGLIWAFVREIRG